MQEDDGTTSHHGYLEDGLKILSFTVGRNKDGKEGSVPRQLCRLICAGFAGWEVGGHRREHIFSLKKPTFQLGRYMAVKDGEAQAIHRGEVRDFWE